MSDTTLFDILRAFQVRDTSEDAEIRALTDRDITRAIERHHARQTQRRPRNKSAPAYRDPTGGAAARNADKDKNKRKTRRPRRGVELRGQVIEVPTVELDTLLPG